jgi:DNA-binding NarL/FixJ family response regulator
MIRVVLVDDDDLMRAGLRELLTVDSQILVVGEASDGSAAIASVLELRPDVVLMDVRMPGVDGIRATEELASVAPECRVLVLTTFENDDYVFGALRAGASGFLLKRTRPDDLIAAVHTVAAGDALLAPTVTRRVIDNMVSRPGAIDRADAGADKLTKREHEVCLLLAQGLSNRDIADRLHVEDSTASTHVKRVLAKLGLRDRIQVVIWAYESGIVVPGARPSSDPN